MRFGDRVEKPELPAPMGTIAADTGVSMGTFHEEKMIIGISGSNTIKEEPGEKPPVGSGYNGKRLISG